MGEGLWVMMAARVEQGYGYGHGTPIPIPVPLPIPMGTGQGYGIFPCLLALVGVVNALIMAREVFIIIYML